jgi:hypothetical protein
MNKLRETFKLRRQIIELFCDQPFNVRFAKLISGYGCSDEPSTCAGGF